MADGEDEDLMYLAIRDAVTASNLRYWMLQTPGTERGLSKAADFYTARCEERLIELVERTAGATRRGRPPLTSSEQGGACWDDVN